MMIKKYAGIFSNLRVAVIYKKYSRKKRTPIKHENVSNRCNKVKRDGKTHYKYPSRAYRLLTDSPQPWAFIACIRHAS